VTFDIIFYLVLSGIGLMLSALFSGAETGLYTINRVRLTIRANRGDERARRLRALIDRPGVMLTTILIGNNIANYIGSYGLAAILETTGLSTVKMILVNVAILTPMLFIFGEILPKDFFRVHTDTWSYTVSRMLIICRDLFYYSGLTPLVQAFGHAMSRMLGGPSEGPLSGRQRVIQLLQEGVGAGVLSEAQTTMVNRSLSLRSMTVGDEMVPWSRVMRLHVESSRDERDAIMRRRNFSRLPLVDDSGKVVGVLRLIDALLQPDATTRELMEPVAEFPSTTPIRAALSTMRHDRRAMAVIVHPRTNRTLGIVTLKDLVEPLTGELAVW